MFSPLGLYQFHQWLHMMPLSVSLIAVKTFTYVNGLIKAVHQDCSRNVVVCSVAVLPLLQGCFFAVFRQKKLLPFQQKVYRPVVGVLRIFIFILFFFL